MRLAGKWVARIEARSVTPDTCLVPECLANGLAERDAAVFHGVMRVHFQIASAAQLQVHHRVLGEERQHVVKKREPRPDRRLALAIDFQLEADAGFFRIPLNE